MTRMTTWKETLGEAIPAALGHEIDSYEEALASKREGKIENPVFAEMRLRRGVYGQRYDNGRRYDGIEDRALEFPCGETEKGPGTIWDAPGMQRIKIPWGGMSTAQMESLADVAEEYSDGVLHVTTRQDIQLHFIHIEDTPDLMRRLAAVGITTREACGNVVRNVTACPRAGVCDTEVFDVTPYAQAVHQFILGHPDAQNFGRKFKIAFSGCAGPSCGLIRIHDVGCIARVREVDGKTERGFEFYIGGGLGAVPYQAQLFDDFMSERDVLPTIQAIGRVFARLGEKKNRTRARLKFLIKKLGFDEFKRLVLEERAALGADPRWTSYLENLDAWQDKPLRQPTPLEKREYPDDFEAWRGSSVSPQRQEGYALVTVGLPLGDITSSQLRALADIARKFTGETCRTTIEQNFLMRWVNVGDLYDLYVELAAHGLAGQGAGTIADGTACPGTDTCKLGIAASRGLMAELNERMADRLDSMDPAVKKLRVKASGCFNSCGQHHVADIGFWGVSRKVRGELVPHFQVVVGGQWESNGGSYGLAIGAAPSKNVPVVLDRILDAYVKDRDGEESFQSYIERIGKPAIRDLMKDLLEVPAYDDDPSYYFDWGDPRRFSIGDLGVGECAGEVVESTEFDLQSSEREVFEAQVRLDQDDVVGAADIAYQAMYLAAKALARTQNPSVDEKAEVVVEEFRTRLYDTEIFLDRYAGGKFAHYYFRAHDEVQQRLPATADLARKRIEEAQLFVEAAHACFGRMS